MKKILQIPARSEFDLMLFLLGLLLFNWPLLTVAAGFQVEHLYLYLFLAWAGIISMLLATARAILRNSPMD